MLDRDRLKVFISYARRDASSFAEELVDGLEIGGFDAFLDRQDIAPGEDWEKRLDGLIAEADTVIFVVTPASVASERCEWELSRAELLSKRILPVVAADIPDGAAPSVLSKRNYIHFSGGRPFARSLKLLVAALNTDIDWIREHTRLGDLAARWVRHDRPVGLLLRGPELAAAQQWLASSVSVAPTDLHRTFIEASAAAAQTEAETERIRLGEVALQQAAKEQALALAARRNVIIQLVSVVGLAAGGGLAWWGWDTRRQLLVAEKNSIETRVAEQAARTDIAGQLIAYGATPGTNLYSDTADRNRSIFSRVLVEQFEDPNVSIATALAQTQDVVRRALDQRPLISSSMNGEIYLKRQPESRTLMSVTAYERDADNPTTFGTEHSAKAWNAVMLECGFPDQLLPNATLADLRKALGSKPSPTTASAAAALKQASFALGVIPAITPIRPSKPENSLAVFFFSGIGLIRNGRTLICPDDADFTDWDRMEETSLDLAEVTDALEKVASAAVIVLDVQFKVPPGE